MLLAQLSNVIHDFLTAATHMHVAVTSEHNVPCQASKIIFLSTAANTNYIYFYL